MHWHSRQLRAILNGFTFTQRYGSISVLSCTFSIYQFIPIPLSQFSKPQFRAANGSIHHFRLQFLNCVSPFSSWQTQSREHSLAQHGLRRPHNAVRAFSQSSFSLRTPMQPDNVWDVKHPLHLILPKSACYQGLSGMNFNNPEVLQWLTILLH